MTYRLAGDSGIPFLTVGASCLDAVSTHASAARLELSYAVVTESAMVRILRPAHAQVVII